MKGTFIKSFDALTCNLWKQSNETDHVLSAGPLKSQVQMRANRFKACRQHDALEFLLFLLGTFKKHESRIVSRPKSFTAGINDSLSAPTRI